MQDLRLNGDVEAAGGVVGDDEFRRADQGDGDDDALRHAAAHFMREGLHPAFRIGDLHGAQDVERQAVGFPLGDLQVDAGDVGDLLADRQQRVQLAARVGHDHGDVAAAHALQFDLRQGHEVLALEDQLAGGDAAGFGRQAKQAAGEGGLAGAGFADQSEDLAAFDAQVEVADGGVGDAGDGGELDRQAGDVERRRGGLGGGIAPGCGRSVPACQRPILGSMAT